MDPLNTVPPFDHGSELKKRIRDRDGDEPESPAKRPRANTSNLLPAGQPIVTELKPELSLNNYNKSRLQAGLQYVSSALVKRNITPRTKAFLEMHKDAIKVALSNDTPTEASVAVVQAFDQIYHSSAFYFAERTDNEKKLLDQYVLLRRYEFLGSYGDYLGQDLKEFRSKLKAAAKRGAPNDVHVAHMGLKGPKTWVEIADELLEGANAQEMKKNVDTACGVLGLDAKHMLWLIEEWADRCRKAHNFIREEIDKCHWPQVAAQIARDLTELPNVAEDEATASVYDKVIRSIADEYFDIYDYSDSNQYFPNDKAKAASKAFFGKGGPK